MTWVSDSLVWDATEHAPRSPSSTDCFREPVSVPEAPSSRLQALQTMHCWADRAQRLASLWRYLRNSRRLHHRRHCYCRVPIHWSQSRRASHSLESRQAQVVLQLVCSTFDVSFQLRDLDFDARKPNGHCWKQKKSKASRGCAQAKLQASCGCSRLPDRYLLLLLRHCCRQRLGGSSNCATCASSSASYTSALPDASVTAVLWRDRDIRPWWAGLGMVASKMTSVFVVSLQAEREEVDRQL